MARWFLRWTKLGKTSVQAEQACQPIFTQLRAILTELYKNCSESHNLLYVARKFELSAGGEYTPEGHLGDVVLFIFEDDPQLIEILNAKIRASELERPSELGWDFDNLPAPDFSKKFKGAGWEVIPTRRFPHGFKARSKNGLEIEVKEYGKLTRKTFRTLVIANYDHLRSVCGDRDLKALLAEMLP